MRKLFYFSLIDYYSCSFPSSLQDNKTLCELLSLWRVFILQGHMANEFG